LYGQLGSEISSKKKFKNLQSCEILSDCYIHHLELGSMRQYWRCVV